VCLGRIHLGSIFLVAVDIYGDSNKTGIGHETYICELMFSILLDGNGNLRVGKERTLIALQSFTMVVSHS
jgi:hypothetical protein